ncbi:MAG: transposase [Deltaproteobacteria bacterium]|nr:transposase [Deltaproteobacteria bacterium]
MTTLKDSVRAYEAVTRDLVRVKNRFKHLYRSRGITYSGSGCPFCTEPGGNASACKKPGFHVTLELWRMQQECLEAFKEEAGNYMLAEANRHSIIKVLKTAPGFGPIRSAQLLSIVMTPYRFRTSRQFWAYCGLGIVQRSSSDWVLQPNGKLARATIHQVRGLNQNFNRTAKAIFKGAATTVIHSKSKDPLRADYERLLLKGTKPNLAKLTIARKISAIVLSMWKHQEVYNPEKYRAVTS